MLTIHDLRCEHEQEPLSVAASQPRFSWKIESDQSDVSQVELRLQVGLNPSFENLVWDSGAVVSSQSHLFKYGGPVLDSSTGYFFRVQVRDNHGDQSEWSEPAWFETALPAKSWCASFIGMEFPDEGASSRPIYFRKEFTLNSETRSARIYATALGLYELWLNGVRVGDAYFTPGWTNYRKRLAYQTYDVTELLQPGRNVVGAVVGPGWYKGDLTWLNARNLYGEQTALSVQFSARNAEEKTAEVLSDASWRVSHGPIMYSEIYHGERYDARLEHSGWSTVDFDESEWAWASILDFDAQRVVAQDGPPVCKQERLSVQRVLTTPRGETVLDFGQNLTGWVEFSVSGKAGDRVVLRHAEVLDAEGNFYTANLRSARATVEYILKGGQRETFEPHFTFHGFRFVKVEEYPGQVDPADFAAVVLHSKMEQIISFECSNRLLNQLHHNILWGWKGNTLDVPTDCPQRDERLGWTGDAQIFSGTATYLTHAVAFFRKWLRDLASEQREDGGVPFVVPDVLTQVVTKDPHIKNTHSSTGWGDAAVVCPWTLYVQSGDSELLGEQYASMKAWIEYIRAHAEGGLIWNTGFHFGDWVALDAKEGSYLGATPNDLTATAYYAYSTGLLATAAEVLGEQQDAARYKQLSDSVVEAFQNEFITPSGRIAARTQTAHVLALVFDLVPPELRGRVTRDLAALIEENSGHLTTGFLGTPFICRALAENGRLDLAYELLLKEDYPSWLYQVKQGATTVWEHWDGLKPDGTMWSADMNSFNHYAYGSIGEWMYRVIGGISPDPDDPGFHSVVLAPQPGGGITSAKTSYNGPYGRIALEWRVKETGIQAEMTVPPNSFARIILEGVAAGSVTTASVITFHDVDGCAVAKVGSGTYRIDFPPAV